VTTPPPTSYLADTHILIWALNDPDRLSAAVTAIVTDETAAVFFSPVNLWEIAITYGLGKLDLAGHTPEDVLAALVESAFVERPLTAATAASSHRLPRLHKDPFDRLLVWDAIQGGLVLLSADATVDAYADFGLRVVH